MHLIASLSQSSFPDFSRKLCKMELFNRRNIFLMGTLAVLLNHLNILEHLQVPSFRGDLYQVLGLQRTAEIDDIDAAYNRLYLPLLKSMKTEPKYSTKGKLMDIQHAYDTLADAKRRRNYDIFHLDELQAGVQLAKKKMVLEGNLRWSPLELQVESATNVQSKTISLTSQNFDELVLKSDDAWVIQLYSIDSLDLVRGWDAVAEQLEGVAKVGRVEIGELPLSILLAEKSLFSKQPRFKSGLPEVVALTPECRDFSCVHRYRGSKSVEAVVDWVTTSILKLPRISYYNTETLMKDVIQGAGPHKVKVLVFSNTGERALPYIRQAAHKNSEYTKFAMILWQEQSAAMWESKVGVTSAPALVFVKDPGLKPVIHHGALNSSHMEKLMDEHKTFELPQLRSISACALGCDARGNSMAGNDTTVWYCVIVAGRISRELTEMRAVLRGVLQTLKATDKPELMPAAEALRSQRLSLSWLDGEKQKDFCYFYLYSPTMFEACGPQRGVDDVPQIFLVRYQRKVLSSEEREKLEQERALRAKNAWVALLSDDDDNVASQLVSKYNGTAEIGALVEWVSQMVYEGDKHELPSFRGKMPELIPEEKPSFWAPAMNSIQKRQTKAVQSSQWLTRAFSWITQRS